MRPLNHGLTVWRSDDTTSVSRAPSSARTWLAVISRAVSAEVSGRPTSTPTPSAMAATAPALKPQPTPVPGATSQPVKRFHAEPALRRAADGEAGCAPASACTADRTRAARSAGALAYSAGARKPWRNASTVASWRAAASRSQRRRQGAHPCAGCRPQRVRHRRAQQAGRGCRHRSWRASLVPLGRLPLPAVARMGVTFVRGGAPSSVNRRASCCRARASRDMTVPIGASMITAISR